jgi:hypothetical protein
MHARHLLVLQQDSDHFPKAQVGAERQLTDAIAVLVCMAVVPEVAFEVRAIALRRLEPAPTDFEHQRSVVETAVLGVEIVARCSVADERAVH